MDKTKIDLNAKAFFADKDEVEAPTTDSQPKEEIKEEKKELPPSAGEADVEQRVPYSRLKTVMERARAAEEEAREARERLQELEKQRRELPSVSHETPEDLPSYWVKLYGDTDASKEAFKYELARQDEIRREAKEEALKAVREERTTQAAAQRANETKIDEGLEDLTNFVGRELTEEEQVAVLDIVDEYTPKDDDGSYAGATIPFEKAWEIYEMKQANTGNASKKARAVPTALTGQGTNGEPSVTTKNNQEFNPMDWSAWRKRITS